MGIDRCTEFFHSFGPQVCTESLEQGIRFLAMEFDGFSLESLDCFGGKMTGSPYIWWGQPWFPIAIRCSKLDIVAQHHGIFRLCFSHISCCFFWCGCMISSLLKLTWLGVVHVAQGWAWRVTPLPRVPLGIQSDDTWGDTGWVSYPVTLW